MAENVKIGHFWNPLCVNFQKMVSDVKKNYSPGPQILKQCSLQSGEVLRRQYLSLSFHSDLFWAGSAFLMHSLAEAYDAVNQRGF